MFLFFCSAYAQETNFDSKRKTKDSITIGFYCGFAGNKSQFVKDYEKKFLLTSDLNELKNNLKLTSIKQAPEAFLSLIICEALEKHNLIEF